jgi:hypothetical protein
MEILTYPAGVLVGILAVTVDLGGTPSPAVLRLDGRPVCALVAKVSTCEVDLGPMPHPHVLDAVRFDDEGRVLDRVARPVNVPGRGGAHLSILDECSDETRTCTVRFAWVHPDRKAPRAALLAVDGEPRPIPQSGTVEVPYDRGRGHVVTLELDFGDEDRSVASQVVGPFRHDSTEVALQTTPVAWAGAPRGLEERLRRRGVAVEAVEKGEAEVTFVVQRGALSRLASLTSRETASLSRLLPGVALVTVVPAGNPGGSRFPRHTVLRGDPNARPRLPKDGLRSPLSPYGPDYLRGNVLDPGSFAADDWLKELFGVLRTSPTGSPRTADAVAAAGFSIGGVPRRRALVLILGDEVDASAFAPSAVRAYLEEIAVPLLVWDVARTRAQPHGWPGAVPIAGRSALALALGDVQRLLDGQVVVWASSETPRRDLTPE